MTNQTHESTTISTTDYILGDNFQVNVDTLQFVIRGAQVDMEGVTSATIVSADGEVLCRKTNRKAIAGKAGRHALHVRYKTGPSLNDSNLEQCELLVEGSPFANVYGQNVWSSGSVRLACRCAVRRIVEGLNIAMPPETRASWDEGNIELNRVDLAVNFRLQSSLQVDNAITQLKRLMIEARCQCSVHVRYVAWCPRNSKDYRIAVYDKGSQLSSKASGNRKDEVFERLVEDCKSIMRVELRLLRPELQKLGLLFARDWQPGKAKEVFRIYFARLPIHDVTFGPISEEDFDGISERMRPVLALHKHGTDWRPIYSKRTRARHKTYFKKHGIHLDHPNEPGQPISLATVLGTKGTIAKTPKWLIDARMAPRKKPRPVGKP